ncbi:hypothetical protein BDR06DRAFT_973785 [Suillus hirtellus]|nr:hypothetical protein BDR06DRAFT_973785 [Suillus hirtellus]
MTLVSNDPSWWPFINASLISSYFSVAACAAVIYDWVLTFGQEVELVWEHTVSIPTISTTDVGCHIMSDAIAWVFDVVNVILGVIMIARLHAMYQRSRKMLIFLVVIFLAIRIANAVMVTITMTQDSGDYAGDSLFVNFMSFILVTVWEVLALCLAVWIAVKHFRELRRHATRGVIGDCFTVLMKTHVGYFAGFFAFACLNIGLLCPTLLAADISIPDVQIYYGFSIISAAMQLSVLGPRLILSVREYHAKLVADSDTTSTMTSIAFQDRIDVENNSSI